MTEVKNSSIELLARQTSGTNKKDEKAVDRLSGFKTMLKSKNQRKDSGNEETKDSGNVAENAVAETAAVLVAAKAAETQNPGDMLRLMGQGLDQKLAKSPAADNVQGVMTEAGKKVKVLGQLQKLNQLRFQNLTEQSGQEPVFKEDAAAAVLPEAAGMVIDAGSSDKAGIPVKTGKKESAGKKGSLGLEDLAEVNEAGSAQENEKGIPGDLQPDGILKTAAVNKEEDAVAPVQTGKTGEKPVFVVKDEKKLEENPEISRETSHESNRSLNIQPQKDEIAYTTVKAESLDGLESKLSQQILTQIHGGKGELDVQLEPHNLGKIHIKISYEDSQVSVSVLCSESKTLKLLSHSAGELGSILENNLERPVQILVDKQGADYLNNQKEQSGGQEQHQPQHENRKEESSEDFLQKLRLGIFETGNTEDSVIL